MLVPFDVWFSCFFFFKQKTAYEMRISDWSSDVCSSDLPLSWINGHAPPAVPAVLNHGFARSRWKLTAQSREPLKTGMPMDRPRRGVMKKIGRASCRERVCQYV